MAPVDDDEGFMPSQHADLHISGRSLISPEQRLQIAALDQAKKDLRHDDARVWMPAAQWFFIVGDPWIYAFGTICISLEQRPRALRKWARRTLKVLGRWPLANS